MRVGVARGGVGLADERVGVAGGGVGLADESGRSWWRGKAGR